MEQEKFLQIIRKKIGPSISLIEQLSQVLDISYDAAHRRASNKSKLSLEETAILARHYGISMDNLFQKEKYVLVNKTKEINSFEDLSNYLSQSFNHLSTYKNDSTTEIYYSAKDIPLFYTLGSDVLSQFKRFVWMQILNPNLLMPFKDFQFKAQLLDSSQNLLQFYDNTTKHEIWNDTTINSTLQQILYFYDSNLLSTEEALAICEQVEKLIITLESQCNMQNDRFKIYHHDLLILNNNVLVCNQKKKTLFVPYTMLGYFITNDEETCNHSHNFFQHQLKNSKLLNTAGTRDKKLFFNKMYKKIKYYKDKLNDDNQFM